MKYFDYLVLPNRTNADCRFCLIQLNDILPFEKTQILLARKY